MATTMTTEIDITIDEEHPINPMIDCGVALNPIQVLANAKHNTAKTKTMSGENNGTNSLLVNQPELEETVVDDVTISPNQS